MRRWLFVAMAILALGMAGTVLRAAEPEKAAPPMPPADEPAAGTQIVHPVDGSIMVWVPSGYFTMGFSREEGEQYAKLLGYKDYLEIAAFEWFPKRQEYVEGFFIDKYELTNELWNKYVQATGYKSKLPKGPPEAAEGKMQMYPANSVYWAEAQQYANWARKSLPYEKQWEKAARGTDGRWFPWGNEIPTAQHASFPINKKLGPLLQVGSLPKGASPYGAMDMAGNVYEWTCEWQEPYPNNPEAEKMLSYVGHASGCLRGGSFYHAIHAVGAAKRFGFKPDETYYHVGFRTVWSPPAGYFKSNEFKTATGKVSARMAELEAFRKTDLPQTPSGFIGNQ